MTQAVIERTMTKQRQSVGHEWDDSVSAEEAAERMAEMAKKLQESQPSMSLKTLMGLVIGAVQGKSHRQVKL